MGVNDLQPINPSQDRRLDPETVQWFCTGCPYLGIDSSNRQGVSGISVGSGFGGAGVTYDAFRKTNWVCTSPQRTYNQFIAQDYSTLGVGFCAFMEQKMDLLYDSRTDDGGS